MFYDNFNHFLEDVQKENQDSKIYKDFLNFKNEKYLKNTSMARKVLDFIAGMTDDYFIFCYHESKKSKNGAY